MNTLTRRGLHMDPVVTLTVDDCWKTHARGFSQAFDSLFLRGVFYVIAGFVGKEVNGFQFVEWDDLRQMSAQGHEIGSHSFTHKGPLLGLTAKANQIFRLLRSRGPIHFGKRAYTLLRLAEEYPSTHLQQDEEVVMSKLEIEKQVGRICKSYSYPGGEPTSELINLVSNAGYTSARTIRPGLNYFRDLEPYSLRVQVWDQWTTAKTANKWVDRAISKNLWLIEVFHVIDLPGYPYSGSEPSLKEHLSYIRSKKGKIENLTISEAIDRLQTTVPSESLSQRVS